MLCMQLLPVGAAGEDEDRDAMISLYAALEVFYGVAGDILSSYGGPETYAFSGGVNEDNIDRIAGTALLLDISFYPDAYAGHLAAGAVSYTHLDVYKRQIYICPVADSVNFQLFPQQIFVHHNRLIFADQHRAAQIPAECFVVMYDMHSASAQYIGRPYQHRVADLVGCLDTGLNGSHRFSRGLRDSQGLHGLFKACLLYTSKAFKMQGVML